MSGKLAAGKTRKTSDAVKILDQMAEGNEELQRLTEEARVNALAELRRRKERFLRHPSSGRSWEQVKQRARAPHGRAGGGAG